VSELRDLQTVSPYVDHATLLQALEAPAGGGDPWAPPSEQLPPGGAREPDEITPGSVSRFGSDEPEDGDDQGATPPTSDEEQ